MKRLSRLLPLIALFLLSPVLSWAAGSCAQTLPASPDPTITRFVQFACTGDAADGSIPNTATNSSTVNYIEGFRLVQVEAYPTSGGTAPDAASVFILDAAGLDLLGSEDGSTTAYQGLNLIHATLKRATFPDMYIPRAGAHAFYYPYVKGALTLKVIGQATVNANYTVVLTFSK